MANNSNLNPQLDADDDKGPDLTNMQQAHQAANVWLRYTGMGFQMLGCILIGVGLGWLWDRNQAGGGNPWGIVVGSIAGCALAIVLAVRIVLRGR